MLAVEHFDLQEGFDRHFVIAIEGTGSDVEGFPFVCSRTIQGGHWVDVKALYVAFPAVCLDERPPKGSAIRMPDRSLARKKGVSKSSVPNSERIRPGTACPGGAQTSKPLVNTNERTVILLDLLLPRGHVGYQGNIKGPFNVYVVSCSPCGKSTMKRPNTPANRLGMPEPSCDCPGKCSQVRSSGHVPPQPVEPNLGPQVVGVVAADPSQVVAPCPHDIGLGHACVTIVRQPVLHLWQPA